MTRVEFLYGAGVATTKLIQAMICSAFFLIATLATAFQSEFYRRGLFENASLIPIYLGAIPIGFMGATIPHTINQWFLDNPPQH